MLRGLCPPEKGPCDLSGGNRGERRVAARSDCSLGGARLPGVLPATVAAHVLAAVRAWGRACAQVEISAHVVGEARAHLLGRGNLLLQWSAALAHPFAALRLPLLVLLVLLVLRRRGVVESGAHPRRVGGFEVLMFLEDDLMASDGL